MDQQDASTAAGDSATPSSRNMPQASGDVTDSDEFRMYYWKILPCRKRYSHDWSDCVFAHNGEKVQRRCPRKHNYKGFMCPDMKKSASCPRGDMCGFAHNSFEYWLHPTRYRTELCTFGTACKRSVCFFAHTPSEQRLPSNVMGPPAAKGGGSASPQEAPSSTTPPSTPPASLPTLVAPSTEPPSSPRLAAFQHRHSTGQLPLQRHGTTPLLADPSTDAPWPTPRPSLSFQPPSALSPSGPQLTGGRRLRSVSATSVPLLRSTADTSTPRPHMLAGGTPTLRPTHSPQLLSRGPSTPSSLQAIPSPSSTPPQSPLLPPMGHQMPATMYNPRHQPHLTPADAYAPMPQMLPPPQQQYMQYANPELQQYMGGAPQQYMPELSMQYNQAQGVPQMLTPEEALHFGELTIDDLSQVDQSHYEPAAQKWALQQQQQQPPPPTQLGAQFSPIHEAPYYPITTAPVPGYSWPSDY